MRLDGAEAVGDCSQHVLALSADQGAEPATEVWNQNAWLTAECVDEAVALVSVFFSCSSMLRCNCQLSSAVLVSLYAAMQRHAIWRTCMHLQSSSSNVHGRAAVLYQPTPGAEDDARSDGEVQGECKSKRSVLVVCLGVSLDSQTVCRVRACVSVVLLNAGLRRWLPCSQASSESAKSAQAVQAIRTPARNDSKVLFAAD
ncbi:hypothetical protein BCR34DRAFT_57756 [Clohesyomyces aquaticus]|uniref:Uncharacterized protein n=1 Tax=Clohesyomyces aquaticus TaxID=1231657 RepID=A0A1Y1Z1U7_9PLEO|nr:hypothetical protein BCR34DRAFT_57756 [Clohesyomyces aquaticus]